MYKKIALTLTLALAMFAGTALQTAQAATTKTAVTTVLKGEKGGKKKKKKECQTGEKSGCCANKTAGENGGATGTSANGGTTGKSCPNAASKCCDKKAAEKN